MILALAAWVGAFVAAAVAPRVLRRLQHRTRDPALGLACWALSMLGVVASASLGALLLVLPGHGAAGAAAARLVLGCWSTVTHGDVPRLDEVAAGVIALAGGGALLRLALVAIRDTRRRRRVRSQLDALNLVGETDTAGTVWVPSERPVAFSLGGPRRVVVATTAMRDLPEAALAAVLAHEQAHLRGRHHLLIAAVDAICATAPPLPLFQQGPAAVRELVELAADHRASSQHGAGAVKQALLRVAGHHAPPGALAMGDATNLSARFEALDHTLSTPASQSRRSAKMLWRGAASGTAVLLPVLTSCALLVGLTLVSCS